MRPGFARREREELLQRRHRHGRGRHQKHRFGGDAPHRREGLHAVEGQLRIQAGESGERGRGQQQRMTVGRGLGHEVSNGAVVGRDSIVDRHRLAQRGCEPGRDGAGDRVLRAAGRRSHHQADRRLRRHCAARQGASEENQQARELHRVHHASQHLVREDVTLPRNRTASGLRSRPEVNVTGCAATRKRCSKTATEKRPFVGGGCRGQVGG